VGYKTDEINSAKFMPYSTEQHKLLSDPRLIFNKSDSIQGIVFSKEKPEIRLINAEVETEPYEISGIVKHGNYFLFRHSLKEVKSGNYYLSMKIGQEEIYRKIIAVLSFHVEKPKGFEWSDPATFGYSYVFEMAQAYLNKGDVDASLRYFNRLPESLWNASTLPVIASAFYQKQDFARVVELLEKEAVVKKYSVLLMLGNASLKLKRLPEAAEYFEQLRNYGDTAKINRVLGAIYLSLGEREKAKVYMDRAEELEKKQKSS
jgi:tetratricopeptide (TPR) repeat protein